MIGQFSYAYEIDDSHVGLLMAWDAGAAKARVVSPRWVVDILQDKNVGVRDQDEFMALPMALSYSILIATMAGAYLTVSGDTTVWPREWGDLVAAKTGPRIVKSH